MSAIVDVTIANQSVACTEPSAPATSACVVTAANTTNDNRCTACHTRRGSRRIASDVSSIANSRYIAPIPRATAPGRHAVEYGTRTSAKVQPT